MNYPDAPAIHELLANTNHVVVVQADNPDADSLGSALALEHILGDLGKEVSLYCGVDIPTYLRYLPGWDRVQKDLPKQFDASFIVDVSTYTLLEQLYKTTQLNWLKTKPCVVLDHHQTVDKALDFVATSIIDPNAASTGDVIYHLAKSNGWHVSKDAAEQLMTSILGDTQGLTNELTSAETYRTMAELTDLGAERPKLEELRREASKMAEEIYRYKGELIRRTQLAANGKIAHVMVPQDEINRYSPLYNPAALIQFDMLQIQGVVLSIVFKTYDDGHVTAAIRSSVPIAGALAEHMGGGGHDYASGFKIDGGQDYESIRDKCLAQATALLGAAA
jgi:phosphoesterase RecJ-like protein